VHDAHDPDSLARAGQAFDSIVAAALRLGGTVTGEHGVGRLKRGWLTEELDPVALDLHHGVKSALDPQGILNPGAVL
jgi:glycolate oxidase